MSVGSTTNFKNPHQGIKFSARPSFHDDEALRNLMGWGQPQQRQITYPTPSSSSPQPNYEHRMVLAAPQEDTLSFTPAGSALMNQYGRPPIYSNLQPPNNSNFLGALVTRSAVQPFHYSTTPYTPAVPAPHDSSYTIQGDNLSHPGYLVLEDDSRIDQLKRRSNTTPNSTTRRLEDSSESSGGEGSANDARIRKKRPKSKKKSRSFLERQGDKVAKVTRGVASVIPFVDEEDARSIGKFTGSFLTGSESKTKTGSRLSDSDSDHHRSRALIKRSQTDRTPRKRGWSPRRDGRGGSGGGYVEY